MTDNKKQIVKLTDQEVKELINKATKANEALLDLWITLNDLEGWSTTPLIAYHFGAAYRSVSDLSGTSPIMVNIVTGLCLEIESVKKLHGKV